VRKNTTSLNIMFLAGTAIIVATSPLMAQLKPVATSHFKAIRAQEKTRIETANVHIHNLRNGLGLDENHTFKYKNVLTDEFAQTHTRFQQTYKGIRIWEGDVITHTDASGRNLAPTTALKEKININVIPSLSNEGAFGIVDSDLRPQGPYAYEPTIELVIYVLEQDDTLPNLQKKTELSATDFVRRVRRHVLAFHVHTELENNVDDIAHTDYLIDAHTGAIIKKWSTLMTSAAIGTGNSQFSGTVSLNTNSISSGFELRDMTRGTGGNATYNLNHTVDPSSGAMPQGTIFTDADNTWGDGQPYDESSTTTSANGQTAAVDAHWGLGKVWDFYKNVFNRNGMSRANRIVRFCST